MRLAAALVTLCLGLGCRARAPRAQGDEAPIAADAAPAPRALVPDEAVDAGAVDAGGVDAGAPVTASAVWQVREAQGATLDPNLRVSAPGRPAERTARSLVAGDWLYAGDLVRVAPTGSVRLETQQGVALSLGAASVGEVPRYEGASWVASRGRLGLAAPSEGGATGRVDTPAGRVMVTAGRAAVSVNEAGETQLTAETEGVTLWASPPPPGARVTQLSAAERARLAADAGGHPILLDVSLDERAANLRPVRAEPLALGAVRAFDTLGQALPRPRGPREWARPVAGVVVIGQLSRAGAGDLADVRAALASLDADAGSADRRDRLLAVASLALGRAAARARRGRDLALRGGDVTALVQLARLDERIDEVAAAARSASP
ncbi:MAG: hypothetical protein JNK72_22730 [Myxococcales bacterium]|nr:hypothetical protein [Myxococcales bacterium]